MNNGKQRLKALFISAQRQRLGVMCQNYHFRPAWAGYTNDWARLAVGCKKIFLNFLLISKNIPLSLQKIIRT